MITLKESIQIEFNSGVIDVSPIEEGELISIEFFPNNQTNDSFQSAEFSAVFNYRGLLNDKYSRYELFEHFNNSFDDMESILNKTIEELKSKQKEPREVH